MSFLRLGSAGVSSQLPEKDRVSDRWEVQRIPVSLAGSPDLFKVFFETIPVIKDEHRPDTA